MLNFFLVLMMSLSALSRQILCRQVQCLVAAPRWTCRRPSWTPHRTPPAPTSWSFPHLPLSKWPAPATPTSTLTSTFSTPQLVSSHSSLIKSCLSAAASVTVVWEQNHLFKGTTTVNVSSLSTLINQDHLQLSVFKVKDDKTGDGLLRVKCLACCFSNHV